VREETKSKYNKSQYFVQMPYCIFARRKMHPAGVANTRRREGNEVANDYRGFYLVFAKEPVKTSKDIIYMPTLPNMYEDFKICEGSAGGHNFDSRVSNYWNSEFLPRETPYGAHALSQIVGMPRTEEEYFTLWAKLELKDFARLSYAARTIEQTKFCQGTFFGYSQEEWEKTQPKKKKLAKAAQDLAEREDREDHIYRIQCPHCAYRFNVDGFIIPNENGDHWAAQAGNFVHEVECENCGYFFWPGDGFPVPIE
jgi:hypothetical protein